MVRWSAIGLVLLGWALPAAGQVTITEDTDEGLDCFKVVTDSATYYYDKAGAGFTSLLDPDGNDWIGFHPEGSPGVPNGQSGWYRGIPNMGLNAFGHPGYAGATSTTPNPLGASLSQATIRSTKGGWDVTWDFFSGHARMTVHAVEENYWFLYEGTPGGAVGADDTCFRSSGESDSLGGSWEGDVVNTSGRAQGLEWVFFADGSLDRSLFLAHDDDGITDRYYLMDPMTVFGFGRQAANIDRLLSATPATLLIGLVESRDFDEVADAIAATQADADGGVADGGEDGGGDDGGGAEGDDGGGGDGDDGVGEDGDVGGPDAGDPGLDGADPEVADADGQDAGGAEPNGDPGEPRVSGSCGCATDADPVSLAWVLWLLVTLGPLRGVRRRS